MKQPAISMIKVYQARISEITWKRRSMDETEGLDDGLAGGRATCVLVFLFSFLFLSFCLFIFCLFSFSF